MSTRDEAVGSLTMAAAIAHREVKRDPAYAQKVLRDGLEKMLPHMLSEQTARQIREEMKR
jgi:hypothetical protein